MPESSPDKSLTWLLWFDCSGGLIVGVLTLAASRWLAHWENLPVNVLLLTGIANLVYGCYSLSLACSSKRSLAAVSFLAIANMAWLLVCAAMLVCHWEQVSPLGIIHLLGEGLFVAALGMVEWRFRKQLVV